MKKLLITIFILMTAQIILGQDSGDDPEYLYFAMIYTPGNNWDHEKQVHEQAYFNEHSAFLSSLRKEGKIVIGGRYSNKGFMLLKAKDEAEALALIATDESVANKTFNAEIFLFSVFYKGCLE